MKQHVGSVIYALLCMVALTGCATTGDGVTGNLLSNGQYRKQAVANPKTYFRRVWAVEDNGEIRVSGYLRLKGIHGFNIPDYVEVAFIDGEGHIVDAKKVVYYPNSLYGRKNHREGRFSATFAQVPPAGTTIRLDNVN